MSETPTKTEKSTEAEMPTETEELKPSNEIEFPFPEPTEEQLKEVRQTTGRLILGEFLGPSFGPRGPMIDEDILTCIRKGRL